MKLWKRNAVVAAIVLFVCVAVYLNWSYNQEESAGAGKVLGQAALVGGQTTDPLLAGGTKGDAEHSAAPAPSASAAPHRKRGRERIFCLGPAQPPAGPGQRAVHSPAVGGERERG